MEIVLEALGACMAMDVVPILRKQRMTVTDFSVELSADRMETHPKVFSNIRMDIQLVSPDATLHDLARAVQLSQSKYCSVSTMLVRSRCRVSWQATLVNPDFRSEEKSSSNGFSVNDILL
jgi:putative redox protein